MKLKVAVILGPTATGKSYCGLELAKRLNGEIISGDSMLVYRQMDIGTAKPLANELAIVPHHLVNILPPEAEFNVVEFKERAEKLIIEISNRGRLPIIVGGTGLYIKALLENYNFSIVDKSNILREELESFAETYGNAALHMRLAAIDPVAANRLHCNDVRRVIRAIEIAQGGENNLQEKQSELVYDAVVCGLQMDRDFLYTRINERVDQMLANGLIEETEALLKNGVSSENMSMKSIGYRQITWYLKGDMPLEEAVLKLKQATRNFAKRQMTWYKKMPYVKWFAVTRELKYSQIVDEMEQQLVKKLKLR